MNKTILFCCSLLLLSACKKSSDNRQYSTWHIVGKGDFSTNQTVTLSAPKLSYQLDFYTQAPTGEKNGTFHFTFHIYGSSFLPQSGSYALVNNPQKLNDVSLSIGYDNGNNNAGYIVGANSSNIIIASSYNEKAKLVLDTTWFYNSLNPNDSIKVYGTFLEP